MDSRRNLGHAVCRVRLLGRVGRLEEFGVAGAAATGSGCVHHEVYQLRLVAQIQRHQTGAVHALQLDRRDCVCVGSRVFHQPVYFPELPDSEFEFGEDLACGRFSVREQDGLRCACAADTAVDAADATYFPGMVRWRKELSGQTALGLQALGGLDQSAERRYRGL